MRVLMVNDYALDTGWGAENYTSRLVNGLRDAGHAVGVFAGEIHPEGVRGPLEVWDRAARVAVANAAERFRPDVVHHHNVVRRLTISVIGVPRGAPTVLTVHDPALLGDPDSEPKLVRDAFYALRSRFAVAVVRRRVHVATTYTNALSERLRARGFRDVERIPAFVEEVPTETVSVEKAADIVFVGQLTPKKAPVLLAEAFARVAGRHLSARLIIVGEGPEREALSRFADKLGGDRIVLTGRIDQNGVRAVMGRARVVVVPSLRAEGGPLVVIEAGILGRPLIVTDDPPLRELVDRSGGGIVVKRGSVDELEDALERMLSNPQEAARMGMRAREAAATEHTAENVIPKFVAVYERAIRASSARR
jgi:glycosyltransferase involved in cell wall biosynthesis